MKGLRSTLATLALFAVSIPSAPAQEASSRAGEGGEIKVTAKKYAFDPNPIRVKKGDHVKLVITAVDHDHVMILILDFRKLGDYCMEKLRIRQ